jgi:hypothetical protein
VDGPGGNNNTLPWPELENAAVGQLNLELAFHDQKEFIGVRVLVPRIISGDHSKS